MSLTTVNQLLETELCTLQYEKKFGSQKSNKTQSVISTRKSSSDSIELKGKFKTEMCKYITMRMDCPFSELCCFAHGEEELRSKESLPTKYKTKPCFKFNADGYCPYGLRCQFIHSHGKHIINYEQMMDKLGNDSKVFFGYLEVKPKGKTRRLSFFEKIEEDEGQNVQQLGYQQTIYNLAKEALVMRERHNSI